MMQEVKVLVVGGGAAGLAAAAELEARGIDCHLVEAQARLGGRIDSILQQDGMPFERGAQMINGDMSAVLKLAAEANLRIAPVPAAGRSVCVLNNEVTSRDAFISAEELNEHLYDQIYDLSSASGIMHAASAAFRWWSTPWESAGEAWRKAKWWTSRRRAPAASLAAAIDGLALCKEDHAIARTMICEQYGARPEELDAKSIKAGLDAYASERSDLEFQFPDGMQRITDQLAAKLSRQPTLNTPATHIIGDEDRVQVLSKSCSWTSSRVIVAVPPPVARKIEIKVRGASNPRQFLQAFEAGDLIKTTLTYGDAFWRKTGLSGAVTFAEPAGLEVVDASYDTQHDGRLAAFLGGPEARRRAKLKPLERQQLLLADLKRAFGPDAGKPKQVDEAIWVNDEWSGGGYNATIREGRLSAAVNQLVRFPGPVRFACAELDNSFAGYVEGAIRSGRRAAREVAADLQTASL